MARRWVTSGRLPMKKEAVGIPPRTRLVRLSDVAAIRPIVDPTAAITGEVRKLDLPSIPRQQLQIMEDHQRLLTQNEALRQAVERETGELRAHLRLGLDALEAHLHSRQDTLATHVTQQLAALRDSVTEQLTTTRESIQEQHTELERLAAALADQGQRFKEAHVELVERVNTQDQGHSTRLREVTERLDAEDQRQQQHLEVLNAAQETLERDQARDVAELTAHLEALAPRFVQMVTDARNALAPVQTRVESQVRQRDTLTQELQQEREARQVLSATLATQQEQLDDLRELVETLTKRKNV